MRSRLNVSLEQCQCEQGQSNKTTADVSVPQDSGDGSNPATYNQGNGQEELILMTGPLGEVYTKALSQYFAKTPVDGVEELAVESQAQDAVLTSTALREHIKRVSEQGANVRVVDQSATLVKTPRVIAYVVPARASTRPETIITVKGWVDRAKGSGREVILICDSRSENDNWMGTNASVVLDDKIPSPYDVGQNFVRATEDYYEPIGVTVVNGARGFVDWVKENCGQGKYVTDSVSTEGFLDAVKSFFSKKKKENDSSTPKELPKEISVPLNKMTNLSWVKQHCVYDESTQNNPDLKKFVENLTKAENVLMKVKQIVDKLNGDNLKAVPENYDKKSELKKVRDGVFHDVIKAAETEMNNFPRDLGFGVKLTKKQSPRENFPRYDLEVSEAAIKDVKLSADQIVHLARFLSGDRYFNYVVIGWVLDDNELSDRFDIEWESEGGETAEAALDRYDDKFYLDEEKALDMFGGLISSAHDILYAQYVCLNNHIKDNASKVE